MFEDFGSYMQSLYRLRDLVPTTLYPGHGPVVMDGLDKINQYIEHRLAREKQVTTQHTPLICINLEF